MNFLIFLNKVIISNKYLKYKPFWYWYRMICHQGYRLDDRHLYADFWYELNNGWWTMEYDAFINDPGTEEAMMSISSPDEIPEIIYLTEEDYDAMMEKINNPDPPTPFLRQLLSRSAPWDND